METCVPIRGARVGTEIEARIFRAERVHRKGLAIMELVVRDAEQWRSICGRALCESVGGFGQYEIVKTTRSQTATLAVVNTADTNVLINEQTRVGAFDRRTRRTFVLYKLIEGYKFREKWFVIRQFIR